MSEQRDVPPWALALLTTLRDIGYALKRHGEDFENGQHDGLLQRRGGELESICRAVLATASNSDAGTGERVPRYVCRACDFTTNYEKLSQEHHDATGHNMRWTGRDATSEELAHDIRGTAPASASAVGTGEARFEYSAEEQFREEQTEHLAGAAPEERDGLETPTASLEDLLDSYRHALMDRVRGRPDGGVTLRSEAYAERRAIHLHVEQQKQAAREEGRAEMGEVVGSAQVIPHWEDGDEYHPHMQVTHWLPTGDTQPYTVDLVRPRSPRRRG